MNAILNNCLLKKGLSIVEGGYKTGKTTMVIGLLKALVFASLTVKEQIELKKRNKKIKQYSIKELLDNVSSDEESYTQKTSNAQFPWF